MFRHFLQVSIFIAFLSTVSFYVSAQNFSFTEQEKAQVIKNTEQIMNGSKAGFTAFKTNKKSTIERVDSSFQSSLAIFPAKTKSTAHIHFFKKFIYYREKTEADFYDVTQVLKSLLRRDNFFEIKPEYQESNTFFARAFSDGNAVVDVSYRVEDKQKFTYITILRSEDYPNGKPQKITYNNWEPEKKGYGFSFRSNGKDSVIITEIYPKNSAAQAGLLNGDLITAINNTATTQKTTAQIVELFERSPETSTFTYLRNGKTQKAVLQKDWKYKYDKTCLSGDCANGNGVAMSNVMSGVLMEGKFSDGQLVDGNWYYNAKSLQEKGTLFRRGKIIMNRFFTGNSYDPDKPDGGWWYQVTYHDVVKNFNIVEKTLNGYVFCYADKTKKYLWEGELTNGKKSGDFAEYLYDKGFYWSYYLDAGEKYFHKLKKLTSEKLDENWLNDDALKYNESTKTWSGIFNTNLVNSKFQNYSVLENVGSYNDIEPMTLARHYSKPSTSNNGDGNTKNSSNRITVNESKIKVCSHCNGNAITYTYLCTDCNNTGMTKYLVGTNSWNATSKFCGCVGYGMLGWNYIKNTLDRRKKVCSYCNGKGVEK